MNYTKITFLFCTFFMASFISASENMSDEETQNISSISYYHADPDKPLKIIVYKDGIKVIEPIQKTIKKEESILFTSFKKDGDYYKNKKIITTEYDSKTEMRTVVCADGATHTFNDPRLYLGGSETSEAVEMSGSKKKVPQDKCCNIS